MTVREDAMRILADNEPRTAREIAKAIEPDASDYRINVLVSQVKNAMNICIKWDNVKVVGEDPQYGATIYQVVA